MIMHFLSSVKRVIVAFKVGDLGIFVCTRAVVSYMGILFSSQVSGKGYLSVLGHVSVLGEK